jgi:TM2 domain-containing membrane protein YozV
MAQPTQERRSIALAYVLWMASLLGVCGLQRFYARKPFSGTLWLFTLGFCGIGQFIDLFLIPDLVEQANQPLLLQQALAMADRSGAPPIERQLLQLARQAGGQGFTINDAILAVELPSGTGSDAIRAEIEKLLIADLLDVGNDERGRVVYREP